MTTDILCLGDSTTVGVCGEGSGGYRGTLIQGLLRRTPAFRLVGSQQDTLPGLYPLLGNHEGHSGWTVEDAIAALPGVLAATPCQIACVLLGLNDTSDALYPTLAQKLDQLLDLFASLAPQTWLLLGNCTPCLGTPFSSRCASFALDGGTVNNAVARCKRLGRRVLEVDTYSCCFPAVIGQGLGDASHPSPSSYANMGEAFLGAIDQIIPLLGVTP